MPDKSKPDAFSLGRLSTDLGERSTYDAASQCSRCGYCEQACPTYVATGQESKSPRGRNQIVRLMLEGKLKDFAGAQEALSTCLLCGACATACYAHVPTADIVLEGRRMAGGAAPRFVRILSWLLIRRPRWLEAVLKIAYSLKRLGFSRLASRLGLLKLLGLKGLEAADAHVSEAPAEFLSEILRRGAPVENPRWTYFAACGSNYLFPRVGLATNKALTALRGEGRFLDNACCGLLAYNYGDVADARTLAGKNIELFESRGGQGPVVADCSSCAAFLKSYPQLFLEDSKWKTRAEAFSGAVKDAVEVLGEAAPSLAQLEEPQTVTYHDSCRARHGQGLSSQPREAMRRVCGGSYRELPESDVCCGGAGAFSFVNPELSDEVLRRKIVHIKATQARRVVTSSTSCLIQLAHGLKNYYPECEVVHLSELAAQTIDDHGKKTGA